MAQGLTEIFGDDFDSIVKLLDTFPEGMETMLGNTIDKMLFDVQVFGSRIEQAVSTMSANGMTTKQIERVLKNDMKAGGRIFGELRNNSKESIVEGINQSSRLGQFEKYGEQDSFAWVTVGGHKVCPDCDARAGEVKSWDEWVKEGLPASGWSFCRGWCYCVLDPVGKMDKKVVVEKAKPEKKTFTRKKPVKSGGARGEFNKKFASDDKGLNKHFQDAFKTANQKFTGFITKNVPAIKNMFRIDGEDAYHKAVSSSIHMGKSYLSSTKVNARGYSIARHEYGHYMLEQLTSINRKTSWFKKELNKFLSSKTIDSDLVKFLRFTDSEATILHRFGRAFKADQSLYSSRKLYIKGRWGQNLASEFGEKIGKALATLQDNPALGTKTSIRRELFSDYININDLFGALTKNKLGYGHETSYYTKRGVKGQLHEVFANLTEIYTRNPEAWAWTKERLPELTKFYEDLIDGNII